MILTLLFQALCGTVIDLERLKKSVTMMVLILESVPPSLRGEISRWMIEPKAGVFVGKVSAMVRDKLWEKCIKAVKAGNVVQLWSTNNEQGFSVRSHGERTREIIDVDGLFLVRYVSKPESDKANTSQ